MNGHTEPKPNSSALIQRDEFGASQLELVRETAATAVAAREKAAVEARYIMALKRPRKIELTRQDLLKACSYPAFAEAAWYSRPAGQKFNKERRQWEDVNAEGFSIRFAEEALRAYGNVYPEMVTVFESEEQRIIRISVTDLESNLTYATEVVLAKRVERKKLKDGQIAIGERTNSEGKKVFIVEATDDEVLQRQNALRSKAMRTDGLRLLPAWLKEECKEAIRQTIDGHFKADPDRARRKMIDDFAALEITVADLEAFFGKPIEKVTSADMTKVRPIYTGLKDREFTWDEIMSSQQAPAEGGSTEAAAQVAEEKLAEIRKEAGQRQAAAQTASETKAADTETSSLQTETAKNKPRGFDFGSKKQ